MIAFQISTGHSPSCYMIGSCQLKIFLLHENCYILWMPHDQRLKNPSHTTKGNLCLLLNSLLDIYFFLGQLKMNSVNVVVTRQCLKGEELVRSHMWWITGTELLFLPSSYLTYHLTVKGVLSSQAIWSVWLRPRGQGDLRSRHSVSNRLVYHRSSLESNAAGSNNNKSQIKLLCRLVTMATAQSAPPMITMRN